MAERRISLLWSPYYPLLVEKGILFKVREGIVKMNEAIKTKTTPALQVMGGQYEKKRKLHFCSKCGKEFTPVLDHDSKCSDCKYPGWAK